MNLYIKSLSIFTHLLVIEWNNNQSDYIKLKKLRASCPCAGCSGETDVMGNLYIQKKSKLSGDAFVLSSYEKVGLYGVRFFWKDGHHDGIYTFSKLASLSDEKK